jgi:hypothetical protein
MGTQNSQHMVLGTLRRCLNLDLALAVVLFLWIVYNGPLVAYLSGRIGPVPWMWRVHSFWLGTGFATIVVVIVVPLVMVWRLIRRWGKEAQVYRLWRAALLAYWLALFLCLFWGPPLGARNKLCFARGFADWSLRNVDLAAVRQWQEGLAPPEQPARSLDPSEIPECIARLPRDGVETQEAGPQVWVFHEGHVKIFWRGGHRGDTYGLWLAPARENVPHLPDLRGRVVPIAPGVWAYRSPGEA